MFRSARLRFAATLLVSLLGCALTLCVADGGEPADSPLTTASLLPPPQR
jgi:hypothetical protein